MILTLRIENVQFLEGGSPIEVTTSGRPIRVGRASRMDWVLPDPTRFISSHHFDVEPRDGAYWLTDRSTNGTFLVGQPYRLDGPYRLSNGDRFQVGNYYVAVTLGGVQPAAHGFSPQPPQMAPTPPALSFDDSADPWSVGMSAPAPVDPMPRPEPRRFADFSDEFIVTPGAVAQAPWPQTPQPSPAPAPVPQEFGAAGSPFAMPQPPASMLGGQPAAAPAPIKASPFAPAAAVPVAPAEGSAAKTALLKAFCEGAGLPTTSLDGVNPETFAHEMGRTMRIVASELMILLQDRATTKKFTKGGERTMIGATNNNPLKFLPDATQALDAMFVSPRDGFLKGGDGIAAGLADVRLHQMAIFAAIQPALIKLLSDLAPEAIDDQPGGGGLLGGSNKKKSWDTYVERWDAKAGKHENGMLDAFLTHFAEAYSVAVAGMRQGR